jgi:Fic family protein
VYVEKPPSTAEFPETERLLAALQAPKPSEYVHWDKLRHLTPPDGVTAQEWWWGIKWSRRSIFRALPLTDGHHAPFSYLLNDEMLRLLHFIDQRCSGEIAMPAVITDDEQARQHYLVNSLMEEAIRSSQLEGATTSRKVAKELLRTGREPRNRSERMILNNYRAIQFMREQIGDKLTPAVVLELQGILTRGTLDNPDSAGRMQRPDEERIAVCDRFDGSVLHHPPPADQLPERLDRLCGFANEPDDTEPFMHPVVRSILLHLWLAYDHPFEDGNGRTARALFYWSMRKRGYWLVEYLSISQILAHAPAKYTRAFLNTETDELDATYFLLYQLSVIERAVKELHSYLRRKTKEVTEFEKAIKMSAEFNHRQLALLGDAIRHPDRGYTFRSHGGSHNVTHETSRRDILGLEAQGLFVRRRAGRRLIFYPSPGLADLLKRG